MIEASGARGGGTGLNGRMGALHDLFLAIGFGLVTASILALSTVGLSLQFSVTNLPNFAHGEIMTAGAYAALVTQQVTNNALLAGLAAGAVGGLLALLLNAAVLPPFVRRRARPLGLFLLTIPPGPLLHTVLLLVFAVPPIAYSRAAIPAAP